MRGALRAFCAVVLVVMLVLTVQASVGENMFDALVRLWPDAWFRATLADTYLAFLTIALWVAWKERGGWRGLLWALAVLGLGNMAIAVYVLLQLATLPAGAGVEALLARRRS